MSRRYNRVEPNVWLAPWSDDTRTVALYLLTCQHRTTEGLYRLPRAYVMDDLRWPAERFQKGFDKLLAEDFIRYDEQPQVVWIVKAFERQPPDNKNVALAAIKRLAELPKTVLLQPFLTVARSLSQPFATALDERFPELLDDPQALSLPQAKAPQSSTATQPPHASENVEHLKAVN